MDIVNKVVRHDTYGKGKICEVKDDIITIQFDSTEKSFIYPDAFKEHLFLTEKKSKQYIEKILEEMEMEKQLQLKKEILEAEKRKLFRTLPLNDNAQAAFAFIHNDKQKAAESGCVSVGNFRSGYNRGNPRIPARIYPNSACLLTFREKKDPEEARYIWGAFMAHDDFIGSECTDGIVPAHKKYRIVLDENERKEFLFWKYFPNDSKNKSLRWGSVEFKYFSNMTMSHILHDIIKAKRGTAEQQLCEEFFEYFCELNKIDKQQIS